MRVRKQITNYCLWPERMILALGISKALLPVANLLDMGAGLKLINKDFLLPAYKKSIDR